MLVDVFYDSVPFRHNSQVIGGWLPPLTFAFAHDASGASQTEVPEGCYDIRASARRLLLIEWGLKPDPLLGDDAEEPGAGGAPGDSERK
jgi:hypothetical protein